MFKRFTKSSFAILALTMAAAAPVQAGTGMPGNDAIAMLIKADASQQVRVRRQADPSPYAFRPTRRSQHRQVRRRSPYATGCEWAAYQQCLDQRAAGKSVICYHPGN